MKKHPKEHLDNSEILTVVIKTTGKALAQADCEQPDAQRAMPVTEIGSRLGYKFTLACASAIALTAVEPKLDNESKTTGIDIDSN